MPRLKSRERQVPGGYIFYCPQIPNWRPQPWSSLDSLADQVIQLRLGNPFLTQKHGWRTDKPSVLNELDEFNATMCQQMGYDGYYIDSSGGSSLPKHKAPTAQEVSNLAAVGAKARQIWSGVKTLNDWLEKGAPSVDRGTAESRAVVCSVCPLNGKGDLTSWFTVPAAGAIKRQVEKANELKLTTSVDESLGVCSACLCPNKLKIWLPVEFLKANTSDETLDKLRTGKDCWIIKAIAES